MRREDFIRWLREAADTLERDHGCGDGGCRTAVLNRGGQHTNGGCRCGPDYLAKDMEWMARELRTPETRAGWRIVPPPEDPTAKFNAFHERKKGDLWREQVGNWHCRHCGAETVTPHRASPFPRSAVLCGECDHALTSRTSGGMHDPFNWVLKSAEPYPES